MSCISSVRYGSYAKADLAQVKQALQQKTEVLEACMTWTSPQSSICNAWCSDRIEWSALIIMIQHQEAKHASILQKLSQGQFDYLCIAWHCGRTLTWKGRIFLVMRS